jgi:hypothetical protein
MGHPKIKVFIERKNNETAVLSSPGYPVKLNVLYNEI